MYSFVLKVRVRFAPSPTGHLHLGSLRTALYNFLFARHHKGQFVLRIEDTDKTRLIPGCDENASLIMMLSYILFEFIVADSEGGAYGPYKQSDRLTIYKEAADCLIHSGHAYRCFCSEERLSLLRKDAIRRKCLPNYDRKCLSIDSSDSKIRAAYGEPFVIRFKLDKQNVLFTDDVYGDVEQHIDESDMILMKSDGFPTYHLANIVDDRSMQISHVIRGMEWLSSTGKHVILYRAFGWSPPKWIHLPIITRDGKKKLSKRDRDGFVDFYEQELGVLPDAVLNLLIRNGSGIHNFDPTHLYTLDEMIAYFDEKKIGKRNLQIDQDCLERYGRKAFQTADINSKILPIIKKRIKCDLPSVEVPSDEYLQKVVEFLRTNEENFAFLSSLTTGDFQWFFTRPTSADRVLSMFDHQTTLDALGHLQDCRSLDLDSLKEMADKLGWAYNKFLSLVRVSLIDNKKGPPIKELVSFFGTTECRKRFHDMIEYVRSTTH
ncbi:glutamate--tRNA ligase, partial [Dictyocaulus viviparus]